MTDSKLFDHIGGMVGTSLIDFPGVPSAVLFYRGCNLQCPYCHNPESTDATVRCMDPDFIQNQMESAAASGIEGVVLTGGEPLLWRHAVSRVVAWCQDHDLKIKLDTNGLLYHWADDIVTGIVDACDYVAVDYKLPFWRYGELASGHDVDTSGLRHLIQGLDTGREPGSYELRTTVCPSLLKFEDLEQMAEGIPRNRWYLQQFRSKVCLDRGLEGSSPYPDERLRAFAAELGCNVRGVP